MVAHSKASAIVWMAYTHLCFMCMCWSLVFMCRTVCEIICLCAHVYARVVTCMCCSCADMCKRCVLTRIFCFTCKWVCMCLICSCAFVLCVLSVHACMVMDIMCVVYLNFVNMWMCNCVKSSCVYVRVNLLNKLRPYKLYWEVPSIPFIVGSSFGGARE